jgi:hypothetical protein
MEKMARNQTCAYLKFIGLAAVVFILIWPVLSCGQKLPLPGLEISVCFSDKNLSDNLLTSLNVKFITTSDFKSPGQDYELVAEASAGQKILFQKKLPLLPPVSRWEANRVYESSGFIYFPPFIDFFSRRAGQGLPVNFRLYLVSPPNQKNIIVVYQRQLKLSPCPPDVPDIVFLDGWVVVRRPEVSSDKLRVERWTGSEASCWLKNPQRPALLMLRGSLPANRPEGQKVIIALEGKILEEFETSLPGFEKIYQLAASDLGQKDGLTLTIKVNKTLKVKDIYPGLEDDRPVGFRLETIYFR